MKTKIYSSLMLCLTLLTQTSLVLGACKSSAALDLKPWDTLFDAIKYDKKDTIIKYLEKENMDPAKLYNGICTLHQAVLTNQLEIVAYLIGEQKVDINIPDASGNTSLMLSVKKEDKNMVEWLLKFKASVDVTNNEGQTALHLAALTGNIRIIDLLLEKGADINAQNNLKQTPAHLAVNLDNKESLWLLKRKGASFDIPDKHRLSVREYLMIFKNHETFAAESSATQTRGIVKQAVRFSIKKN